jgi:hypothetical protein
MRSSRFHGECRVAISLWYSARNSYLRRIMGSFDARVFRLYALAVTQPNYGRFRGLRT